MNPYIASKSYRKFLLSRHLGLAVLVLCVLSHSKPLFNGISFVGLNGFDTSNNVGSPSNEKFCYVLDHLNDAATDVPSQLASTLAAYQKAGVNLIRILINAGADFGCSPSEYGEDLYNGGGFWGEIVPLPLHCIMHTATCPWCDCAPHNYWPIGSLGNAVANRAIRANRIATVNSLLDLAFNNYGIRTEILFSTPARVQPTGLWSDPFPYTQDKAWISAWLDTVNGLHRSGIAVVGLMAEARIQSYNTQANGKHWIYPDSFPAGDTWTAYAKSSGDYAKEMWSWFHVNYPTIPGTIEFLTVGYIDNGAPSGVRNIADSQLVTDVANWMDANLPGLSYASVENYFYLPVATATTTDYLTTEKSLLNAYFSSNYYQSKHVPLWIDEFGHAICASISGTCPATEINQANYFYGALNATEQYSSSMLSGRVSWVGTNDQPYDGVNFFGLISSYDATNSPVFRPAWNKVTSFYLGNPLAVPSAILPLFPP